MSKSKQLTMAQAFNAGSKAAAAGRPGGAASVPSSCDTPELRSAFVAGYNAAMQHKREGGRK